ncbi:MAG: DUF2384 domain-containing protein [Desulfarculaceae bacterium]|nr:DUF2384 domain-containing protein [Desulfarculaceae bacterium]
MEYKKSSPGTRIQDIERGLPFKEFDTLRNRLELTQKNMGQLVGIGHNTLAHRKRIKRLTKSESERVDRVSRIFNRAKEVFGDEGLARKWLKQPLEYFDGKTPLQYASTELGGREVENLLGRIEHGVFS